jgi:copper resistance protein B
MNATNPSPATLRLGTLVAAIALGMLPVRVSAQQMDPNMKMPMSMPAQTKPVTKIAAKKPVKNKFVPAKAKNKSGTFAPATFVQHAGHVAPPTSLDHTAMGNDMPKSMPANDASMQGMDHSDMDHGNMAMPATQTAQPMDQSRMTMPANDGSMQGMDHSNMDHGAMTMPTTQPREPIPALTNADRAAAAPPVGGHAAHDNSTQHYALFDRLEAWNADKGAGLEWEGKAWIGTDLNRVWLRSEGERVDNKTEAADLEVLYGHSVATWWDVVAGVRHDFQPGASRDFAAIGVMGVVPSKYEVEATAYIGQSGQTAARIQAEYDTLLTGRLILQSLVEANLYGQDNRRRGIGSGLSTLETGFRLRYEFTRQFAPYIGIVQERAFGRTAGLRHDDGKDINDTRFVAGIRIWF